MASIDIDLGLPSGRHQMSVHMEGGLPGVGPMNGAVPMNRRANIEEQEPKNN